MSYLARISILLLCAILVESSFAETVVTPAGLANQEGRRLFADGTTRPPTVSPNENSRAQFIYHSSTFSSVSSGPIRITEINLRPDGARSVGDTQGYDNLRLVFAVTSDTPDEASTSFENNLASIVSEPVVAYDQAWEATVISPVPTEGTRPFDFKIELTDPFEFDPNDGHLMVDWFFGLPTNLEPHTSFDSDAAFGNPLTEFPEQQGIYALGGNPTGNGGQIVPTQFVFESVPEPAFSLATVLLVVGFASRFRRRQ